MAEERIEQSQVFGVHPVLKALESGKEIEKVFIKRGLKNESVLGIRKVLKERAIPCQDVPIEKLNRLTRKNHQGIVALLAPITYHDVQEVVRHAYEIGESPLILLLDRVSDVGNFGAICRSAACAGVHGILIPVKGSAQLNSFAVKSSAGAIFDIAICRTAHILSEVRDMQTSGLRVLACSEKAEDTIYNSDLRGPAVIVMGSEEEGIGPGLLALADEHVQIPLKASVSSLNVSVATGIVLFERLRQTALNQI